MSTTPTMTYGNAASKPPSGRVNKADHDKVARLNREYRVSPEQKRQKMINKSVDHFQNEASLWSRVGGTVKSFFFSSLARIC